MGVRSRKKYRVERLDIEAGGGVGLVRQGAGAFGNKTHNYRNNNSAASGKLAAYESVTARGSTNHKAAPEWSNQTYLTLQLMSL